VGRSRSPKAKNDVRRGLGVRAAAPKKETVETGRGAASLDDEGCNVPLASLGATANGRVMVPLAV
jgi:hypothetical protein